LTPHSLPLPHPPRSTLFPYTTLFRSEGGSAGGRRGAVASSEIDAECPLKLADPPACDEVPGLEHRKNPALVFVGEEGCGDGDRRLRRRLHVRAQAKLTPPRRASPCISGQQKDFLLRGKRRRARAPGGCDPAQPGGTR